MRSGGVAPRFRILTCFARSTQPRLSRLTRFHPPLLPLQLGLSRILASTLCPLTAMNDFRVETLCGMRALRYFARGTPALRDFIVAAEWRSKRVAERLQQRPARHPRHQGRRDSPSSRFHPGQRAPLLPCARACSSRHTPSCRRGALKVCSQRGVASAPSSRAP